MAGTIGDLIMELTGNKDPRQQLLASMTGTPGAAGSTPGGAGGVAGTAAPGAPAQPQAYTSPPDLMQLYNDLANRQAAVGSFNRGVGLVTSAFAKDQNKEAIMDAFDGGGGGYGRHRGGGDGFGGGDGLGDPMTMMSQIMKMNEAQTELARKAQTRAALPEIAKKYNLDVNTASYLLDSGGLDDVIKEASKPNKQVVKLENGRSVIVDVNSGDMSAPFGPSKQRDVKIVDDGMGGYTAVDSSTGAPIRTVTGKEKFGKPPGDMVWKRDAAGNHILDENGTPVAIPIGGSELDQKTKAALSTKDTKDANATATANIVTEDIDRASSKIEAHKGDLIFKAAGPLAAGMQFVPGSDAYDTVKLLDTVRANVGFDRLQQMRAASSTGAALGPVSDFENKLLQATAGNLEIGQSPDQLQYNLARVRKVYDAVINHGIKNQAEADALLGNDKGPRPKRTVEEILKEHGGGN